MSIRPIVIYGDPVLHNPTEIVDLHEPGLEELIHDMFITMDAAHGVGLAANQIGVNKRIFVFDCPDEEAGENRRGYIINPILETSEIPETLPPDDGSCDEGCLSVPGEYFPTGRADWAKVTGVDLEGKPVSYEGHGFFARCLQHETGHLDGFVYTDVLTGRWKRAAKKSIKAHGWNTPGNTWTPGQDKDPFGHDDQ